MEMNRRDFVKIIAIGSATAGLPGCTQKIPEKLIPYVIPVEEIVPGKALWYSTVCRECPAGCGMRVRVREGRAVKAEGNPEHPLNRGKLCSRGQSALQGLYHPDRLQTPLRRDEQGVLQPIGWEEAEHWLAGRIQVLIKEGRAAGIVWLTPLLTGSLDRLIDEWSAAIGFGRRLRYEAIAYESLRAANRLAFGQARIPAYDLAAAKTLFSFGADFLETWISPVRFANDFARMRRVKDGEIGRFIYFGPRLSLSAANADEFIAPRPGGEGLLALAMAQVIVQRRAATVNGDVERLKSMLAHFSPAKVADRIGIGAEKIEELARLFAERAPSLALSGGAVDGENGVMLHAAVNVLNYAAGNFDKTIKFAAASAYDDLNSYRDLFDLAEDMGRGKVTALFVIESNPVFSTPAALGFAEALEQVPLVVSFSSHLDETCSHAHLVLPIHTALESWGDYEPWEGMRGLQQPVMQPVFKTKMLGDTLLLVARQIGGNVARRLKIPSFYDYLRADWHTLHNRVAPQQDFEDFWQEALVRGGHWEERPSRPLRLNWNGIRTVTAELTASQIPRRVRATEVGEANTLSLLVYPSANHFDGRSGNRPWLQELPDPLTQIVWDNWAEIHPVDAARLGLSEGDVVQVRTAQGACEIAVRVYPGIRPGVLAIPLGQGHTDFGRYASNVGVNPMRIMERTPVTNGGGLAWFGTAVHITRTGRTHKLACVAGSDTQEGRGILQFVSTSEIREGLAPQPRPDLSMYPKHEHPAHRWGMAIDLNACTGCSACVIACYAENNIPAVGKKEVMAGREMAWLQVQRYFDPVAAIDELLRGAAFLPMLCQHCDQAPCEPVCPVFASYHTAEGLNAQVYNRCVGTRDCANNCPYKVRRFNWLTSQWPEPLNWQLNPDVTVRTKGVMEKCTFCVQRIAEGKMRAREESRAVVDGDIVPACAQSCPAEAIVFGDLNDPNSRVAQMHKDPRGYRLLESLNTRPAVVYLRRVRIEA